MLTSILVEDISGAAAGARRAAETAGLQVTSLPTFCPTNPLTPSNAEQPPSITLQPLSRCNAVLWFGATTNPESQAIAQTSLMLKKPLLLITPEADFAPEQVSQWLLEQNTLVLAITGCREKDQSGIEAAVESLF